VPTEFSIGFVGTHDHGERIPTHDRRKALFKGDVARMHGLLTKRNRVLIRRVRHDVRDDAELLRLLFELREQKKSALTPARSHGRTQRFEPFGGFLRIGVVQIIHDDTLGRDSQQIVLIDCVKMRSVRHDMPPGNINGA
jgi:hypothetical protein